VKPQLSFCADCGYKIFLADERSNTPKDIGELRKKARAEKFHFTTKEYKACPQCGYPFDPNKTVKSQMTVPSIDYATDAFAQVNAESEVAKAIRDGIKGANTVTDNLETASNAIPGVIVLAKSSGANLDEQIVKLAEAINRMRDQAIALADAVAAATKGKGN
jgi:DNA-directed RNA polymerase subunit RPC12/RpoP